MGKAFTFSPMQRKEVVKIINSVTGVPNLEEIVQEYREKCAKRMPLSEIRDRLQDAQKHSRKLIRAIKALSKGHNADNDWVLEPVSECEHYAKALLKYRFSRPLKPGRPFHTAEIHLVQRTALIWDQVCKTKPGRGRGPFSKLVGLLFACSEVKDAPTKHPHEVVAEALPPVLSVSMVGKNYPFAFLKDSCSLPPVKKSADCFFSMVLWVSNGSPTAFATSSKEAGEIEEKM